jgi:2-dehydro-3-deoxygluconokinase
VLGALRARVVTFGEAMLRLSPPDRLRLEQARTLEIWPAGAELNVAVGLARLGSEAAWVSRLPVNPLGEIVLAHARSFGIDVSGVLVAEDGRLGLYFVEVSEPPLASRALYDRAASAFALLDPDELDWRALLAGARAFHVTGITPALSAGCARATADALASARAAGCHTSYDLNLRTLLAPPKSWRARLEEVAPSVDTLVCSVEDARAVLGLEGSPDEVAAGARDLLGVERAVVSRRVPDGGLMRRETAVADSDGTAEATSPPFRGSEPVGAGDAFCAGFLHGLLSEGVERGLLLGGAMAAVKQAVPGDAPVVALHELELALAEDPRMRR